MSFRQLLTLGSTAILLVGYAAQAADYISGAAVVLPVFEAVYAEVAAQSDIPILLPTSIPDEALRESEEGQDAPFFVSTEMADANQYEVNLDAIEGCVGAGYCNFGVMGAERITADTESVDDRYAYYLDPDYQPTLRSDEPISEVELSGGITGIFIPWILGANYSTAKVYWEQDGICYYVGIRGPVSRAIIVDIANSMIENQEFSVEE